MTAIPYAWSGIDSGSVRRFFEGGISVASSGYTDVATYDDPASLAAAVQAVQFPTVAATKDTLVAYANARQWAKATGGYTATVAGQSLTFATDPLSQGLITGKALRLTQPNAPASVDWQFASGFVTIAAADFITVATEIADFVQSTFDTLKTVVAAIASGTITANAAVDAAFSA